MLERGGWVRTRPANWAARCGGPVTPYYSMETPYRAVAGAEKDRDRLLPLRGRASVFYGGASLRFRAEDFEPAAEIGGDSGAAWPYRYATSSLIRAGGAGARRRRRAGRRSHGALPQRAVPAAAGRPRAHVAADRGGRAAAGAASFAPAARVQPRPRRRPRALRGVQHLRRLRLRHRRQERPGHRSPARPAPARACACRPNMVAVRLVPRGARDGAVDCVDRDDAAARCATRRRQFVLAAGALASPHLLLASGLDELNPAGRSSGGYLMRHFNAVVIGLFPRRPDREAQFHKQIAHPRLLLRPSERRGPAGSWAAIQQLVDPARRAGEGVSAAAGGRAGREPPCRTRPASWSSPRTSRGPRTAWPSIPQRPRPLRPAGAADHASLHGARPEGGGRSSARRADPARGRRAGHLRPADPDLLPRRRHRAHGRGPATSPLDADCRFRGTENLHVVDGSSFPTSAAVNPSLTIAAQRPPRGRAASPRRSARPTRRMAAMSARRERAQTWSSSAAAPSRAAHSRTLAACAAPVRCFYASRYAAQGRRLRARASEGGRLLRLATKRRWRTDASTSPSSPRLHRRTSS